MTLEDYKNLLILISSPRLLIQADEAQTVALLQLKLQNAIKGGDPTSPSLSSEVV